LPQDRRSFRKATRYARLQEKRPADDQRSKDKPELKLYNPRAMTFEKFPALCSSLAGKEGQEPTEPGRPARRRPWYSPASAGII
jgi:hypothetical protein